METSSFFQKLKPHLGLILAGLVIGAAVKVTYFSPEPAIEEEVKEIVTIPDNKNTLYPDEAHFLDSLPADVMPQYPTIYKSHGKITASVISRERTPYGDVVVFDYNNSVRCFLIEGVNESCWNFRTARPSTYTHNEGLILKYLAEQNEVKDILVVGVGAGTLLKDLNGTDFKIDAVDINPAMPELAENYFILPKDLDFEYLIDDGRHFLNTTDKKYDAIILDLCFVNEYNAHLWTKEFYALTKNKLKDPQKGFLIASRGIVVGDENRKLDAMIGNAMLESFPQLYQVDNLDGLQEGSFDMGVYVASEGEFNFAGIETPKMTRWEFDKNEESTSDDMLDQLVDLFRPAADSIREQTLTNWGKDMFLPL